MEVAIDAQYLDSSYISCRWLKHAQVHGGGEEQPCGDHAGPFDPEGEDLAFHETAGNSAEVAELVDLHDHSSFEAEDVFDM